MNAIYKRYLFYNIILRSFFLCEMQETHARATLIKFID